MGISRTIIALAAAATLSAAPAAAQRAARPGPADVAGYAALAERTLGAPVILAGAAESIDRIPGRRAPDLEPGSRRYLVTFLVRAALKAPGPVPARVRFLWDVASETRPDLIKRAAIVFLTQQTLSDYRLTQPDALIAGAAATEATVRAIVAEARTPDLARRRVTGVQSATHVPGTVPGEAETQIFLKTAGGDPVSLIVISRPGEFKQLSAAFGDAIDEAAAPVKRDTLPWFYLACGLPADLPADAIGDMDADGAAAARADYRFAVSAVGPCAPPQKEASSTPTAAQSG